MIVSGVTVSEELLIRVSLFIQAHNALYMAYEPTCPRPTTTRVVHVCLTGGRADAKIAELFVEDKKIGASGTNWVMHVFGRDSMAECTQLAQKIVAEFSVNVHVSLESEATMWL